MSADHKAKAVKHIENVGDFSNSESNDWPLVNATIAQAHATLALVEQQRIANLIALENQRWQRTNERGNYWGADVLRGHSATPEGTAELYPEIKKALGLS